MFDLKNDMPKVVAKEKTPLRVIILRAVFMGPVIVVIIYELVNMLLRHLIGG